MAGWGGVYRQLASEDLAFVGPLYFFIFMICVHLFLKPMFLAIIHDAFTVKYVRFSAIREQKQEMVRASRVTVRKRKGAFDKRRYALRDVSGKALDHSDE